MIKKLFIVLPVAAIFLAGCDSKERAMLQTKVDSMQVENQKILQTMLEVGALMDSIDESRQLLKVGIVEGTSYDDYTARMKDINNYVKETEGKITDLESQLKKAGADKSYLSKMVKKLNKDLKEKTDEIAALQMQVEEYKNKNEELVQQVGLQDALLQDKEAEILAKQQELALIEARIQELMIQSKMTEADAYYARAVAVEEAANRTKLAPRKKKETLKEALELYKKSLSLGKNEAQAKIDELEKKIQ